MGEKDHSDKQLAGDGGLSYVPLDVDRRRARRVGRSDRARRAARRRLPPEHALHDHAGRLRPHRIELQLDRSDHVAVDRGARRHQQRRAGADIYFSSKGHDAPALYSLLIALGKLDFDLLHKLRRLGGLPGHPDVETTPFIATNTGSLGMGISKAYGMARAHRFTGRGGRIVRDDRRRRAAGRADLGIAAAVRQRAARRRSSRSSITTSCSRTRRSPRSAISGRSKTSSARSAGKCAAPTATTSRAIRDAFAHFATVTDRPKVLIADTIKGKGVSFMEGLACGDQTYHFHAGAPSLEGLSRGGRAS